LQKLRPSSPKLRPWRSRPSTGSSQTASGRRRHHRRPSGSSEGGNGSTPAATATATTTTPPQHKHLHTAKAEAKLRSALDYLTRINEAAKDDKAGKWVLNESILASLTGCFRPTVRSFMAAHRDQIDSLNRIHGLGPGHNRSKARAQKNAIKNLVEDFKEKESPTTQQKTNHPF
jgi:hypothetical protein